ncbi:uncharacterized protein LOC112196865 isoform X1 [Rosa chinensis]|uniref:uncharacterized protein LOC112196865 isoform X1 n=1 Tax=Rosa chinensis TaxID=74649 RepID=UPI001AD8B5D9|nr:uncharacterized protein LOC112196865 isoform X1 [Rosa chinensis]
MCLSFPFIVFPFMLIALTCIYAPWSSFQNGVCPLVHLVMLQGSEHPMDACPFDPFVDLTSLSFQLVFLVDLLAEDVLRFGDGLRFGFLLFESGLLLVGCSIGTMMGLPGLGPVVFLCWCVLRYLDLLGRVAWYSLHGSDAVDVTVLSSLLRYSLGGFCVVVWMRPIHQAYFPAIGEEREKAAKQYQEVLKILEDQCLGDQRFFGGETIGMVDIVYGMLAYWFECMEEAVGVKVIEPSILPRLHAWVKNLKQVSVINDNLPHHGKLLAYYKTSREKLVSARSTLPTPSNHDAS